MHRRTLRRRVAYSSPGYSPEGAGQSQELQQRHRPRRGYHQLAQGLADGRQLTQPSTYFWVTYQRRYSPSMSQCWPQFTRKNNTCRLDCLLFLCSHTIVVWLVYAAKVKAAGKALPLEFAAWPVWVMFAACGILRLGFALPNAPFSDILGIRRH